MVVIGSEHGEISYSLLDSISCCCNFSASLKSVCSCVLIVTHDFFFRRIDYSIFFRKQPLLRSHPMISLLANIGINRVDELLQQSVPFITMLPRSFFTFSRDGNFAFKFLCRIATSLFKKAQFLSPWEVYLSGISLIITSSICLKLELITLSAARAVFSTSFAAVHSFHSRRLISFPKFDLSIFFTAML